MAQPTFPQKNIKERIRENKSMIQIWKENLNWKRKIKLKARVPEHKQKGESEFWNREKELEIEKYHREKKEHQQSERKGEWGERKEW